MKYLHFLILIPLVFASCSDEMANSGNETLNLHEDQLVIRGPQDGPEESCSCETMEPPVITRSSASEEGCCEFNISVTALDQVDPMNRCNIYLSVIRNGVTTTNVALTRVYTTITLCDDETVTLTASIDSGNTIVQCWTRTLDCTTPIPCGCEIEIEQEECELTACVDKNSCDVHGVFIDVLPGFSGFVGNHTEDDDYLCVSITAKADIEYIIRVTTPHPDNCLEEILYPVEGCFDCSNPHWDVTLDGPEIDVYCDQGDGLRIDIAYMKLEAQGSPCCPRLDSPMTISTTSTWYNYSHNPPSVIYSLNRDFTSSQTSLIAGIFGTSFSLDCDDFSTDDHLHFELNYVINGSGDCLTNQSGSFTDYYIVQESDLVPCCFVPCTYIGCPDGYECIEGECVLDPCWGVVCPPWGPCVNGLCTG